MVTSLNCFGMLLILLSYMYNLPTFLYKIYKRHRSVYESHKKKYLCQAGACLFSAALIFVFNFLNL